MGQLEPPARPPPAAPTATGPQSRRWPPHCSRSRPGAWEGLPAGCHPAPSLHAHRSTMQAGETDDCLSPRSRFLSRKLEGTVSLATTRERTLTSRSRSVESRHASHLPLPPLSGISPSSIVRQPGLLIRENARDALLPDRRLPRAQLAVRQVVALWNRMCADDHL